MSELLTSGIFLVCYRCAGRGCSERFTAHDGVGLAVISDFAEFFEVDFAVLAVPLAILVLEDTGLPERDFTVRALPPAVLVLSDTVVGPLDLIAQVAVPVAVFRLFDPALRGLCGFRQDRTDLLCDLRMIISSRLGAAPRVMFQTSTYLYFVWVGQRFAI